MTNRRFELDLYNNGRGKVVVNGQDISDAVRGLMVQAIPGQPTRLALMPAEGYAGRILGEGEVLEQTDGIGAVEFFQSVNSGELEAEVHRLMEQPEGAGLTVADAFLAVLLAQAVVASEPDEVESRS